MKYQSQNPIQYIPLTNNVAPIQYFPDLILFITFHPTHHYVFIKYFLYPSHPKICLDILMRCAVNSIFDCASVPIKYLPKTLPPISRPQICEDILMRNGSMKYFWSEAYWQVCRSDENTKSVVYA